MKSHRSIFTLCFLFACLSIIAAASNYPPDYTYQNVRARVEGPVLFATVGSGIMDPQYVIGYNKRGPLGNGSHVNVVFRLIRVDKSGQESVVEHKIRIEKDWRDTGYMTPGIPASVVDPYGNDGAHYHAARAEIAFYVNNNWDSKNGKNYVFNLDEMFRGENGTMKFVDKNTTFPSISIPIWNYFVDLMKK